MKEKIKDIQRKLGVEADGVIGPVTVAAMMKELGLPEGSGQWPTQKEVRSGKSVFGAPGSKRLVRIVPPYPLYYDGGKVSSLAVHELVADDVVEALQEVLDVYGYARIKELGLDQYGGCYNYRKTTGGSTLSMHAWGIALDFCPDGNGMNDRAPEASLSREECRAWWDIWERHGAVSMGRARGFDWMHVQFARL